MKIRGILVSTNGEVKEAEIEDSLESFYSTLECDLIDCTVREINGEFYDIVCDDEGLFKEHPVVTAVSGFLKPALVGNLFICRHNDDGEWTSLSDDDVKRIMRTVIHTFNVDDRSERDVIWLI